ncbi:tetratricopeptide repeat-containing sensor histidine kinase [Snuella sedimenti]|uniref:histidine kinase n=1 Tax=Snuella sedimenti TaxID=2798802 RepID=A0A8J7IG88_9FLAO|nr:HAMP domain-containing sensor histidine kinase [Snuella sedimenti]MBJ6367278.1 HAMP domain-containing histidine kinase [Snuella sedimenti]
MLNTIDSLSINYYKSINKNPKTGLSYAEKAFSYFNADLNPELKFKIGSNYITALYINEAYNKSLNILDAIESIEMTENHRALYHTLRGLVETDLNHPVKAEDHYKRALDLYTKLNDKDNIFTVLNNLGLLYNNIGDYKRSLQSYLQCYDIITDLKVKIDRYKYFMNIGTVSLNLTDYQNALNSFEAALQDANKNTDTLRIFKAKVNLAKTFVDLKELDSATHYYHDALKGYEHLDLNKDRSIILLRLGDIFYLKNEKNAALKYYMKAYNLALDHNYLQVASEASFHIGQYFQETSDFNKAAFYYHKIIKEKDSITNHELLKDTFYSLYQIEKSKQNALLSLVYLEDYLKYDNEIKNDQLISQKEQIEIQYSLKQKEQDLKNLEINLALNKLNLKNKQQQFQGLILFSALIILVLILISRLYFLNKKSQRLLSIQNEKINAQYKKLTLTNQEIKAQRKELSGLNKIKDQLLSIIAHDVKSPITNLHNLLTILRNHINSLSKAELQNNLTAIETSTSNLLHFLNNILNWIISQSSGVQVKISKVSLTELVEANLKLMESSIIAKNLTVIFPSKHEPYTIKSDLNIIDFALRNILSNAVKFTNTSGSIHIDIKELPDTLIQVRIADTGIGFKEEIHDLLKSNIERVPSFSGTDKEEGYGIGLSLCKKMLTNIDSQIIYEKNEPEGSIFILQLKPMH